MKIEGAIEEKPIVSRVPWDLEEDNIEKECRFQIHLMISQALLRDQPRKMKRNKTIETREE